MPKQLEQINDHNGNLFTPTAPQAKLYKAGWRMVEKKKMGCMKIIRWRHPNTGESMDQGSALLHLKLSQKGKQIADNDPTCYFQCEDCGALTMAPTSDVKAVGHPICPNECGNEETSEITAAEYLEFIKLDEAAEAKDSQT